MKRAEPNDEIKNHTNGELAAYDPHLCGKLSDWLRDQVEDPYVFLVVLAHVLGAMIGATALEQKVLNRNLRYLIDIVQDNASDLFEKMEKDRKEDDATVRS